MPEETNEAVFDGCTATNRVSKVKKSQSVPLILKLIRIGFRVGGAIAPRFAGRLACKMWFTPTRFETPASEQQALESAESRNHSINGQTIVTYSWGLSGPVILLVHGWSGRGTQLSPFVKPLIKAGFRVLSFDCPAHGRSSGRQTTLYEIADAILALNDLYGPFESVITHSFGGPCLAVAIQRGLETSSVINLSPPARVAGLVRTFAEMLCMPAKVEKDFVRRFELAFGSNIMEEASMENIVRYLDIPALVIHDEDDDVIPWHEGLAVAKAWNNAGFIKTRSLGHRRILRDVSTIETVVEFIQYRQSGTGR